MQCHEMQCNAMQACMHVCVYVNVNVNVNVMYSMYGMYGTYSMYGTYGRYGRYGMYGTRKQDHPLEKIFTTTYHFPDAVIITPLAIKLRKETHPYSKSFPHSTNNTHFFSDFPASSQFSWTLPTKDSKR